VQVPATASGPVKTAKGLEPGADVVLTPRVIIRPFVGKVVGLKELPAAVDKMDQRLTMGRTVVRF
jgi:hypothetical protein